VEAGSRARWPLIVSHNDKRHGQACESRAKCPDYGARSVVSEKILAPEAAGNRNKNKQKAFETQKLRNVKIL
jgi:hypothetical protein